MPPLPDVTLNNARNTNVWTNNSPRVDSKLLKLESDCFQHQTPANSVVENDKENHRLIMNVERQKENDQESILFRTLDGRAIKSVQAPGKGKTVPFKVRKLLWFEFIGVFNDRLKRLWKGPFRGDFNLIE